METTTSTAHAMTLLVFQLGVIVVFAKILGHLFQRFRQPRVLGELAAGMVIGPYALGSVPLAIIGGPLFPNLGGQLPVSIELYGFTVVASIVLLFLAGLETDVKTFLRFSVVGAVVGVGGVVGSFSLGVASAVLFLPGVDSALHPAALFLGTLSTATSVGVTARILSDKGKMSSPEGVTILAAAVLDDVLGIIILAVVVGVVRVRTAGGAIEWGSIGVIAARAFGFWIGTTIVGLVVAPYLTRGLKAFRSVEVIAGTSFGIALLLAGLAETAGLAMIIGAYVAGLSLSGTDVAHEIRERLHGLYEFLVPIFFCVMGMMVDFSAIGGVIVFGLIFSLSAIVGKYLGCGVPSLFCGFNVRGAFRVGSGMLPRGEVTLIIAGIGLSAGVIGRDLFGVAVLTLLVATIVAPPLLVKSFDGGPGYRKKDAGKPQLPPARIVLSFPSFPTADLVRSRITKAFRAEEFFVNRVDRDNPIYQMRKDTIVATCEQAGTDVIVTTDAANERYIRLILSEEVVALKDLFDGLEKTQRDAIGGDLLGGIFDE